MKQIICNIFLHVLFQMVGLYVLRTVGETRFGVVVTLTFTLLVGLDTFDTWCHCTECNVRTGLAAYVGAGEGALNAPKIIMI